MSTKQLSLSNALFPKVRQRVLALFYLHPEATYYTNEVIRSVGLGSGVVQRELENLTAVGILISSKVGNQKHYQVNVQMPFYTDLKNIIVKTFGLHDILSSMLESISQKVSYAFVYGSIAKNEDIASSDIDLMIIGKDLNYSDLYKLIEKNGTNFE